MDITFNKLAAVEPLSKNVLLLFIIPSSMFRSSSLLIFYYYYHSFIIFIHYAYFATLHEKDFL